MRFPINLPTQDGRFTDDELFEFCRANPDLHIERDENGQIFFKVPTGTETSFRNLGLAAEVYLWNRQSKLGRASESNGGYSLPDGSMRAPDVAWVSHERLAAVSAEALKKFAPVCPDFVIELVSETDEVRELQKKMEKWLENGVRLGWLVNPHAQETTVYRPGRPPAVMPFSQLLTGEDILPGFQIRISDLN